MIPLTVGLSFGCDGEGGTETDAGTTEAVECTDRTQCPDGYTCDDFQCVKIDDWEPPEPVATSTSGGGSSSGEPNGSTSTGTGGEEPVNPSDLVDNEKPKPPGYQCFKNGGYLEVETCGIPFLHLIANCPHWMLDLEPEQMSHECKVAKSGFEICLSKLCDPTRWTAPCVDSDYEYMPGFYCLPPEDEEDAPEEPDEDAEVYNQG